MGQELNSGKSSFMERAAAFIVNKNRVFLVIFLALILFSAVSRGWVQVENDITVYLPESAEARRGLRIMEEEFTSYGTAQIMVENLTEKEAQALADRLSAVSGVMQVSFDSSEEHYRDGHALFDITFSGENTDPVSVQAMKAVKAELEDSRAYIYSQVGTSLSDIIASEMGVVVILVAIVVVAVLVFTSDTYGEVLVLLGTFLTAAIINMGTNYLMGTISFVSNSVAIVLQLALSVDYAIIFCNRYKEEHELLPKKEAVIKALSLSIPEISASSLTTIAGLTAMTFMEFRLGADMGFVLIKAILCSLLSVFLFMPALLMLLGGLMDRTKHKSFVPKIPFVGKFAHATRFVIPPIFVVLVAGAYLIYGNCSYAYNMDIVPVPKQNEQTIAKAAIEERFGSDNMLAVLVPSGDYEREAALIDQLSACDEVESVLGLAGVEVMDGYRLGDAVDYRQFAELAGVDELTSQALFAYYAAGTGDHRSVTEDLEGYTAPIIDLFTFLRDKAESGDVPLEEEQLRLIDSLASQLDMAKAQLQGRNYSRILLYVDLPVQGQETYAFIDRVHVIAGQFYPEGVCMTGNSVSAYDFHSSFEKDMLIVSLFSISLVMLILLFTFKSFGMPLLLILVIQGSIWINFSIPVLRNEYVFFMCYLIVSSIQMGANIDYAIVVSSRYTELRRTLDRREAMIETMNLSFPTIITSGTMMVLAGLLIGRLVSQCVIAGIGRYVGIGTVISLVLVHFALPQILLFGDWFIRVTTVRFRHVLHLPNPRRTLRRAFTALLAAAALFSLAAAPFGAMDGSSLRDESREQYGALLDETEKLKALAESLSLSQEKYDDTMQSFTEALLTDRLGEEQLAQGEQQYEEGAGRLAEGQAQYNAGKAELDSAKAQYEDGLAQYEAGLAQYEAAEQELEAGKQRLADGQARYDEGMAQLEAAKQEYAEGEAQLQRIEPIYNAVLPLYNHYQQLQEEYNAAEAQGDTAKMLLLKPRLDAAKLAFETQIAGTGYSLSQIIQEYQAGQEKLSSGAAQIAEAEAQLAAAKEELDAGYAQVAAGEAQLAAAREELDAAKAILDDGKAQIDAGQQRLDSAGAELGEGYKQLADAEQKLEEGRQTLEENRQTLQEELKELDRYSSDEERLASGMNILLQEPAIYALAGRNSTYAEICAAAERWLNEQIDSAREEALWSRRVFLLLGAAGLLSLLSILLWVMKKLLPCSAILAGLSALLALAAAGLWKAMCPSLTALPFLAAVVLLILSGTAVDLIARHSHQGSPFRGAVAAGD